MVRDVRQPSLAISPLRPASSLDSSSASSSRPRASQGRPPLSERVDKDNNTPKVATKGNKTAVAKQARVGNLASSTSTAAATSSTVPSQPLPRRFTALEAMTSSGGAADRRKSARGRRSAATAAADVTTNFAVANDDTLLHNVHPPSDLAPPSSSLFGDGTDTEAGPSAYFMEPRSRTQPSGRGVTGRGLLPTPEPSQQQATQTQPRSSPVINRRTSTALPPTPNASQELPAPTTTHTARRYKQASRGDDEPGSFTRSRGKRLSDSQGEPSPQPPSQRPRPTAADLARRRVTSGASGTPAGSSARQTSRPAVPATMPVNRVSQRSQTPSGRRTSPKFPVTPSLRRRTEQWRESLEPELKKRIPKGVYYGLLDRPIEAEPGDDPLLLHEEGTVRKRKSLSRGMSTVKRSRTSTAKKGKQREVPSDTEADDTFAVQKQRRGKQAGTGPGPSRLSVQIETAEADDDAPANMNSPFAPPRLQNLARLAGIPGTPGSSRGQPSSPMQQPSPAPPPSSARRRSRASPQRPPSPPQQPSPVRQSSPVQPRSPVRQRTATPARQSQEDEDENEGVDFGEPNDFAYDFAYDFAPDPPSDNLSDRELTPGPPLRELTPAFVEREPSAAPSEREPTPAPLEREPTPAPLQRDPTPSVTNRQPTPAPSEREPTPVPSEREPTPAPLEREPTPAPSEREPTPAPSEKEPTPRPIERERTSTPLEPGDRPARSGPVNRAYVEVPLLRRAPIEANEEEDEHEAPGSPSPAARPARGSEARGSPSPIADEQGRSDEEIDPEGDTILVDDERAQDEPEEDIGPEGDTILVDDAAQAHVPDGPEEEAIDPEGDTVLIDDTAADLEEAKEPNAPAEEEFDAEGDTILLDESADQLPPPSSPGEENHMAIDAAETQPAVQVETQPRSSPPRESLDLERADESLEDIDPEGDTMLVDEVEDGEDSRSHRASSPASPSIHAAAATQPRSSIDHDIAKDTTSTPLDTRQSPPRDHLRPMDTNAELDDSVDEAAVDEVFEDEQGDEAEDEQGDEAEDEQGDETEDEQGDEGNAPEGGDEYGGFGDILRAALQAGMEVESSDPTSQGVQDEDSLEGFGDEEAKEGDEEAKEGAEKITAPAASTEANDSPPSSPLQENAPSPPPQDNTPSSPPSQANTSVEREVDMDMPARRRRKVFAGSTPAKPRLSGASQEDIQLSPQTASRPAVSPQPTSRPALSPFRPVAAASPSPRASPRASSTSHLRATASPLHTRPAHLPSPVRTGGAQSLSPHPLRNKSPAFDPLPSFNHDAVEAGSVSPELRPSPARVLTYGDEESRRQFNLRPTPAPTSRAASLGPDGPASRASSRAPSGAGTPARQSRGPSAARESMSRASSAVPSPAHDTSTRGTQAERPASRQTTPTPFLAPLPSSVRERTPRSSRQSSAEPTPQVRRTPLSAFRPVEVQAYSADQFNAPSMSEKELFSPAVKKPASVPQRPPSPESLENSLSDQRTSSPDAPLDTQVDETMSLDAAAPPATRIDEGIDADMSLDADRTQDGLPSNWGDDVPMRLDDTLDGESDVWNVSAADITQDQDSTLGGYRYDGADWDETRIERASAAPSAHSRAASQTVSRVASPLGRTPQPPVLRLTPAPDSPEEMAPHRATPALLSSPVGSEAERTVLPSPGRARGSRQSSIASEAERTVQPSPRRPRGSRQSSVVSDAERHEPAPQPSPRRSPRLSQSRQSSLGADAQRGADAPERSPLPSRQSSLAPEPAEHSARSPLRRSREPSVMSIASAQSATSAAERTIAARHAATPSPRPAWLRQPSPASPRAEASRPKWDHEIDPPSQTASIQPESLGPLFNARPPSSPEAPPVENAPARATLRRSHRSSSESSTRTEIITGHERREFPERADDPLEIIVVARENVIVKEEDGRDDDADEYEDREDAFGGEEAVQGRHDEDMACKHDVELPTASEEDMDASPVRRKVHACDCVPNAADDHYDVTYSPDHAMDDSNGDIDGHEAEENTGDLDDSLDQAAADEPNGYIQHTYARSRSVTPAIHLPTPSPQRSQQGPNTPTPRDEGRLAPLDPARSVTPVDTPVSPLPRQRTPTPAHPRTPSRLHVPRERSRSASPARLSPRMAASPSVQARSPTPVQARSPGVSHDRSPAHAPSPSPIVAQVRSPTTAQAQSPLPAQARSPVPLQARSPVPAHARSPTPVQTRSPVATRACSPTPVQTRSPAPAQARSPLHTQTHPRSPPAPTPMPATAVFHVETQPLSLGSAAAPAQQDGEASGLSALGIFAAETAANVAVDAVARATTSAPTPTPSVLESTTPRAPPARSLPTWSTTPAGPPPRQVSSASTTPLGPPPRSLTTFGVADPGPGPSTLQQAEAGPGPSTASHAQRRTPQQIELERVLEHRRSQRFTRPPVPSALSREVVPSTDSTPQRSLHDEFQEEERQSAYARSFRSQSVRSFDDRSRRSHSVRSFDDGTSEQFAMYEEQIGLGHYRGDRSMSVDTRTDFETRTEFDSPSGLAIPGAWQRTPRTRRERRIRTAGGSSTRPWTTSDWRRLQRFYDEERARANTWTPFRRETQWSVERVVDNFVKRLLFEKRELVGEWSREDIEMRVRALHNAADYRERALQERSMRKSAARQEELDAGAPPSTLRRVVNWASRALGMSQTSGSLPTPSIDSAVRSPSPEPRRRSRHQDDDPELGFLRRVDESFEVGDETMAQTPSRPVRRERPEPAMEERQGRSAHRSAQPRELPHLERAVEEHRRRSRSRSMRRRSPSAPPVLETEQDGRSRSPSPQPTPVEDTEYRFNASSSSLYSLYPPLPARTAALTQSMTSNPPKPLHVVSGSPRPQPRPRSASAAASTTSPLSALRKQPKPSVAAARGAWEAHAAADLSFESERRQRERERLRGLRRVRSEIERVRATGHDVSDESFRSVVSLNEQLNASARGLGRSVSSTSARSVSGSGSVRSVSGGASGPQRHSRGGSTPNPDP